MTRVHFNIHLDTCGVVLNDGTPAIVLSFIDNDTGDCDVYPIPTNLMEEVAKHLVNLNDKTKFRSLL